MSNENKPYSTKVSFPNKFILHLNFLDKYGGDTVVRMSDDFPSLIRQMQAHMFEVSEAQIREMVSDDKGMILASLQTDTTLMLWLSERAIETWQKEGPWGR